MKDKLNQILTMGAGWRRSAFSQKGMSYKKFFYMLYSSVLKKNVISGSASLTFYTIVSSIPIFSLILIYLDVDMVKSVVEAYIPMDEQMLERIIDHAVRYAKRYHIGICLIATLMAWYKLISRVEHKFNKIWLVEESDDFVGTVEKVIRSLYWLLFGVPIVIFLIEFFHQVWLCRLLIAYFLLFLIMKYMPRCFVSYKAALRGALVSCAMIALLNFVFYSLGKYLTTSYKESYGALLGMFFILVVYVEYFWKFILLGTSASCVWDEHFKMYMKEECEKIAPLYELNILVLMASYIAQKGRKDDILMDVTLVQFNKEFDLPYVITKRISEKLIQCDFIQWDKKRQCWVLKNVNEDLTVGDVLQKVLTMGSYDMKYNYRLEPLWSKLTEEIKRSVGHLDTKLVDVCLPKGFGKTFFPLDQTSSEVMKQIDDIKEGKLV